MTLFLWWVGFSFTLGIINTQTLSSMFWTFFSWPYDLGIWIGNSFSKEGSD